MFDIIGDIHGHADKLELLLSNLGYIKVNGVFQHSERKVLFVGDYIDRGPKIRETLQIVRSMVERGNAVALMGNHEYNALCFNFENREGGHLRKHHIKNIVQHYETLKQFHNNQREYEDYLDFFKQLPLFFESENFRAVHACWGQSNIDYLNSVLVNGCFTDELIYQSTQKGSKLYTAVEETLKGKEIALPSGVTFFDKDESERSEIRIKWWENPGITTYKNYSVEPIDLLPDTKIEISKLGSFDFYPETEKNVFFGHYWLKGQPQFLSKNAFCLDYSVAKGGSLVAYRVEDETTLNYQNIILV